MLRRTLLIIFIPIGILLLVLLINLIKDQYSYNADYNDFKSIAVKLSEPNENYKIIHAEGGFVQFDWISAKFMTDLSLEQFSSRIRDLNLREKEPKFSSSNYDYEGKFNKKFSIWKLITAHNRIIEIEYIEQNPNSKDKGLITLEINRLEP